MSDYVLAPRALRDLVAAAEYVAAASGDPENGDCLLERMRTFFELLADNPNMGRARSEIRPRLRSFYVDPYVVFYRSRRDGVDVLRILHERQDVGSVFRGRG